MKWILMFAALLAGTAQAEVWTCEMQPRVLGEPRHGETVTHTFTMEHDEESGYDFVTEEFTNDLEYIEEWIVLRETHYLMEMMPLRLHDEEVEEAVMFKKDKRVVKTLVMSDQAVVLADQGFCEIMSTAKEG